MRPQKRPRRLLAACFRCHSQKIKCSGDKPCQGCLQADNADTCEYPQKERRVTVTQRYLDDLEAENQRLHGVAKSGQASTKKSVHVDHVRAPNDEHEHQSLSPEESRMRNPLFEAQTGGLDSDISPEEPGFIGEASCAAFANRLMQCLNSTHPPASAGFANHYRTGSTVYRILNESEYELPDRIQAKLLMNIAWHFIGTYHHLYLRDTFVKELEAVYRKEVKPTVLWICKLYALMALGNVYSNRKVSDQAVPGVHYYTRAMQMLQDAQEECSVMQVEVLAMLAWYANTLGRAKSAHFVFGVAIKMAMSLGMHRSCGNRSTLTTIERESRRRIWWGLYFYERMTASKLGQPITVRDEDINVEMPSNDGLSLEEARNFADPAHLCANVELARILGDILTDIYGLPQRGDKSYVQRVHGILKKLRAWDENLPSALRLKEVGSPRPIASLNLAYNECIIQTTRPILLHLFNTQFQLGQTGPEPRRQTFSSITLALAESCVNAALSSCHALEVLYIDGSIATFGYWDAQHSFSAALILIISAVMKPRVSTSDALQTLISILQSIREQGNIPAGEYCERLRDIQTSISQLRANSGVEEQNPLLLQTAAEYALPTVAQTHPELTTVGHGQPPSDLEQNIMAATRQNPRENANFHYTLADPLIDSFLDQNRLVWTDAGMGGDPTVRDLALVEAQFLFPM